VQSGDGREAERAAQAHDRVQIQTAFQVESAGGTSDSD